MKNNVFILLWIKDNTDNDFYSMFPTSERFYALENVMQYIYKMVNGYCTYAICRPAESEVSRYLINDSRTYDEVAYVVEVEDYLEYIKHVRELAIVRGANGKVLQWMSNEIYGCNK